MTIIDLLKKIIPGRTTQITPPVGAGIKLPQLPSIPSMANAQSTSSTAMAPKAGFAPQPVPMVTNQAPKPAITAPTVARTTAPTVPQAGAGSPVVQAPTMQGSDQPAPQPQPQQPQGPALPSDTEKALTTAQDLYAKSQAISPDELSTQGDIDKLVESTRGAYTDIQDKAIPMEFITGQLASVERRAATLAEPLERKLARLQSQRTSAIEASKFGLDRAEKKLAAETAAKQTAKTEAESARRFGIEQAGAQQTRDLAAQKFEQDRKEFGLTYAQNQQKIDVDKAKEAAAAGGGTPEQAAQRKQEVLTLAQDLRSDKSVGKSGAVGASFQKLVPFGSSLGLQPARTSFESKVNTLKSNLTLDNLKLLKGAMSDKDLAFLNSIASSLDVNMREEDFNKELDRVIEKNRWCDRKWWGC